MGQKATRATVHIDPPKIQTRRRKHNLAIDYCFVVGGGYYGYGRWGYGGGAGIGLGGILLILLVAYMLGGIHI